jgi:SRSO17 transposase
MRIEEVVPGSDQQAMQHLLSDAVWDHRAVQRQMAGEVDALLGGADSCLIVDESAFAKKGVKSAGVARQWNGSMGKVENSQVGVFAALSRGGRVALLDARLYLPKEWTDDAARCEAAGIPESERAFRSKSQLALSMIQTARSNQVRFGWLLADAGYGKEPAFLRGLDDAGERFVIDVHSTQRIYLSDPAPALPERKATGGRPVSRLRSEQEPISVEAWAAQQPDGLWKTINVRHSTQGELRVEAISQRVWCWDRQEAKARQWSIIAIREIGNHDEIHFALSNAPDGIPLERLVRVQRQRFWIEHAFREAKQEVGLGDYQVRTWNGWHRHMTLCSLALEFLVDERINGQDDLPLLSARDLRELIAASLPTKQTNPEAAIDAIMLRHRRRSADIECRSRRQAAEGARNPTK